MKNENLKVLSYWNLNWNERHWLKSRFFDLKYYHIGI